MADPAQPESLPRPPVRTSKARRTQLASLERVRAIEDQMWEKDVEEGEGAESEGAEAVVSRKRQRTDLAGSAADPVPAEPAAAPAAAATPSVRRKFKHPLDQFGENEVALWLHDDLLGSLSQMARIKLDLPRDSWARAAWRASIAMEHTVLAMPIKHRRRLYTLMRHITDPSAVPTLRIDEVSETGVEHSVPAAAALSAAAEVPARSFTDVASATADHLVPELGMTLGHLSVFHILHARTQYVKRLDLEGHVDAAELTQPQAASHRIMIESACD